MSSLYRFSKASTLENDIPILRSSNYQFNEENDQNRTRSKDTTLQWIVDPSTGQEKFRIRINIEGFKSDEVNTYVDNNKLFVYGERVENKIQGLSKKLFQTSYDLPFDIDTLSAHVTFPSLTIMQVDFLSKYLPNKLINSERYKLPRTSYYKISDRNSYNSINTNRIPIVQSSNYTETHHEKYDIDSDDEGSVTSLMLPHSDSSDTITGSVMFPRDFDIDLFYQSVFQPKIFIDDHNQRYIGMSLDMRGCDPDKIQVSINDNDLVVHVVNTNFYRRITLPSNIDGSSLCFDYDDEKTLYIKIKLLDKHSSFKYM